MVHVEAAEGHEARGVDRQLVGADGAEVLRGEPEQVDGGAAVACHGVEVRRLVVPLEVEGEGLVRIG